MPLTPPIWRFPATHGPWSPWSITPTNSSLYVANSNGLSLEILTTSNAYQGLGQPLAIGGDPNGTVTPNTRSFGGSISSVAFFPSALNISTIENLYFAGVSSGAAEKPVITAQPLPSLQVLSNINLTLTAAGFGTPSGLNGYWQYTKGGPFTTIVGNNNADVSGGTAATVVGGQVFGALQFTNLSANDVGSYRLIVNNSAGSVTSSVTVLSLVPAGEEPLPGSFASQVIKPALGAVAFWPLNETGDPSTGIGGPPVIAYDVVGGFNGVYGTNADNGGGNALNSFAAVQGPGPAGFTGFPTAAGYNGALGSLQGWRANTYVVASNTPIFQGLNGPAGMAVPNSTNATLVAWINPQTNEVGATGLMVTRSGQFGSIRTDGMAYYNSAAHDMGYIWDNNASTTYGYNSQEVIGTSNWSMVAVVITPTNSMIYVGNSNILTAVTQVIANSNEPWGAGVAIGGDPGQNPINNSFGGFMSSVAMFSNSLSAAQLENLWIAGVSNGAVPYPFITAQPNPTNIELLSPGGVFSLSASAFGVQPCSGYWQYNSGSGWVTVSSADVSAPSVNTLLSNTLEVGTLMFTNYQAGDNGSYRLVVSNSNAGQLQWVTSSVVSITNFTITSGTFAAALTNPALGTMAFWPLNETIDPSTGKTGPAVIAYDIIGGFNGVYGTNADNGAGNSFYSLPALAGPGANGYPGLPAQGALGVTNSSVFSNSLRVSQPWLTDT